MLEIKNLVVSIDGKQVVKGFSLTVKPGEIHAIMGPNGAGKSTLARVLAGDPNYEVESGEILFLGQEISELEPEERAHLGLFMSFQYPIEIAGITNFQFLHSAYNAHRKEPVSEEVMEEIVREVAEKMDMKPEFLHRDLNSGFSGGEKKKNEILQMGVLDPKMAILDETDSGLDIDALRVVAKGVCDLMNKERGLILITHYQRLLDYIKPSHVHIMKEGKIVKSGDAQLALELEKLGYEAVHANA
ncbi:MAG: Fe-S cluster assembly ATPase SufC [Simkaniaceae bacterium]|nr:Fe-S cluster assembly ATPase SufC [Simkaniaceae bacterium]